MLKGRTNCPAAAASEGCWPSSKQNVLGEHQEQRQRHRQNDRDPEAHADNAAHVCPVTRRAPRIWAIIGEWRRRAEAEQPVK